MSRSTLLLLFTFIVLISLIKPAAAFGAGNIPSYAYLEGKAFRHGDIEDILETIAKTAGGGFLGIGGGKKFGGLDIKRIYFGNLLRDYSQAVDIAGLKKLPLQTIINAVMVLTFLAVGYATEEFEVTKERLGCYLPTEHIDNPKGYGEGEDARNYDSRLRGPVDPRELEVDTRTGMKNYIANEDGSWDTSKSLVRRVLEACIHQGRMAKSGSGGRDAEYEAYRLLGTALHTLEDFTAHSNWCELTLLTMGHHEVFPHVGRNANVRAPNGQSVPILVTGTFGGSDFIHSLLGEAGDHLSSASVSDLNAKVESSRTATRDGSNNAAADNLRQLLFQIPGGGGNQLSRDMDEISNMRAAGQGGGIDPSQMTPQQLHDTLWKIMAFRDKVSKNIEQTLEKIPGLGALVEKIGNGISVFVFTTLEPYMKPLIKQATTGLSQGSAEVINSHDQLEVFRDPNASDPTHSYLSKDHFNLILNEPAGQVAQTIVTYAVERIVKAWDDQSVDARHIIEEILQCLHHPAFRYQGSQIQNLMLERFKQWFDSQGHNQREILNRLKADSVQAHKSIRIGAKGDAAHVHNTVLPDGGLQAALAGSGTHVPGNQYLNAGQDLLSGKMPWQQGFGTGTAGGNTAWRGMDDNHSGMAPPLQTSSTHYQDASSYGGGGGGGYNAPPPQQQHYGGGGGGGYNQPPPQQQSYGGGYDQQPSNDGYPGAGHGHGHGGGHHGGGGGGYGAPSYDNAPNYGGGGNQYGDNSYNQGPPGGDWQGQGGPPHHGGPPPPHGGHGGPQYGGGNQGYGGGGGGYGAPTYGGGGY